MYSRGERVETWINENVELNNLSCPFGDAATLWEQQGAPTRLECSQFFQKYKYDVKYMNSRSAKTTRVKKRMHNKAYLFHV